jgi:lipopolysaccharide transport system permease protein
MTSGGVRTARPLDVPPHHLRLAKPEVVVEGGHGRLRLSTLRELWSFRDVLSAFAVRQVKVKYKQAAIGIGWAVIQPLAAALLFAVFLGRVTHLPSEGVPYLLFALSGMVAWTYFAGAGGTAMESLVADQVLLRKVYFPREVLPIAAVLAGVIDLAPGLVILAVASVLYGLTPTLAWLLLPVPLLLLVLTAAAFGIGLSALNVYYRDIRYALPFVLQLGLFASPIVYSLDAVPHRFRLLYSTLNPVAAAIDGLRRIVLHGERPAASTTLAAFAFVTFALLASYSLFKRLERDFSDRV